MVRSLAKGLATKTPACALEAQSKLGDFTGDASGLEGEAGDGESFHAQSIGQNSGGRKYSLEGGDVFLAQRTTSTGRQLRQMNYT
jgi:hypothetical protein